jgi:Tfp pilus assembly protein PilN
MQHVNLYQDQFRARRDPTDALHLSLALLAIVLLCLAVSGYQAWQARQAQQRLAEARTEQEAAQQRLDELRGELERAREADSGASQEIERVRREFDAKKRLLRLLEEGPLADEAGFSRYLTGLAEHVVDGVWLRRIQLDQSGRRIRLDGHARKPERIPAFMASLGRVKPYKGRTFRTLRVERDAEATAFVLASNRIEDDQDGANER